MKVKVEAYATFSRIYEVHVDDEHLARQSAILQAKKDSAESIEKWKCSSFLVVQGTPVDA